MEKKFTIKAVADYPYCSSKLRFEAKSAFIEGEGKELVINFYADGQDCQLVICSDEGFENLIEGAEVTK